MKNLSLLPIGQAEFLNKLINNDGLAIAEGKNEGATALQLYRKGWIEPFGKAGRQIRWRMKEFFSNQEKKYLVDLCSVSTNMTNAKEITGNSDQ